MRLAELLDRHVAEPDVPDLPFPLELEECADRLAERHRRVRPVELVQRDLLEPQAAEAAFARLLQVIGSAVGRPPPGARTLEASLRGDDQVVGIRMQRLGDEVLAHLGTVRVGGVDEVHVELNGSAQHRLGLVGVGRLAPDAAPGDAHRAEPEAIDGDVAADRDRAGGSCGGSAGIGHGRHTTAAARARSTRRQAPSACQS